MGPASVLLLHLLPLLLPRAAAATTCSGGERSTEGGAGATLTGQFADVAAPPGHVCYEVETLHVKAGAAWTSCSRGSAGACTPSGPTTTTFNGVAR